MSSERRTVARSPRDGARGSLSGLGESLDSLVARLHANSMVAARTGGPWRADLMASVWSLFPALDPAAVLQAFRDSDAWRFVLYELQGRACSKPVEQANLALCKLVEELVEEELEAEAAISRLEG